MSKKKGLYILYADNLKIMVHIAATGNMVRTGEWTAHAIIVQSGPEFSAFLVRLVVWSVRASVPSLRSVSGRIV